MPTTSPAATTPLRRPNRNGCILLVERNGSGGIAEYTHALAGELTRLGICAEMVSAPRIDLPPAGDPYPCYEVLTANVGNTRAKAFAVEAANALIVARWALQRRARCVAVSTANPGRFDEPLFAALHAVGIRLVWIAHDLAQYEWGGVLKPFARRIYAHAAAMVTLSDAERDKLLAQVPAAEPNATRIPHGDSRFLVPEYADRHDSRVRFGLADDDVVLLFFGYLKPYKGVVDFVDLIVELDRRGRQVRGVIAGRADDDTLAQLRARLGSPEVADVAARIRLDAGFVDPADVGRYFAAADVVVLPYHDATQSGVTQLAYAQGRPVVVTDVGGLAEDVEVGVTGAIARPRNVASLADAAESVLADPAALAAMQARLLAAAPPRHAWATVAGQFVDLFDRVLPGGAPRRV